VLNLQAIGADRYRVRTPAEFMDWTTKEEQARHRQIAGDNGSFITAHSATELSCYATGTVVPGRLAELRGVRVLQQADGEIRIAFKPAALDRVAEVIHARRKRRVSPEERARLSSMGRRALSAWRTEGVSSQKPNVGTEA
jgi:hypothetical protein